MKKPVNLRVEQWPYPHLRDDEGCVLANDYVHQDKVDYILHMLAQSDSTPPEKRTA